MNINAEILRDIVMSLVPMILSLTVHEFAHAWSAHKLGDDTAFSQGRMTLNPLAHIDFFGTILIPIIPILTGGHFSLIGWAKPVPVSPYRFRRDITMRKGMIITALAGPLSNLLLAFLSGGILVVVYGHMSEGDTLTAVVSLLMHLLYMNIGLAIFNMLPIYPLDGSRLLPESTQQKMAKYTLVTFMAILLVINLFGNFLALPVDLVGRGILAFWSVIF